MVQACLHANFVAFKLYFYNFFFYLVIVINFSVLNKIILSLAFGCTNDNQKSEKIENITESNTIFILEFVAGIGWEGGVFPRF